MTKIAYLAVAVAGVWMTLSAAEAQENDKIGKPVIRRKKSYPVSVGKRRLERDIDSKVVGGEPVPEGGYKWQVAIIESSASSDFPFGGFFCGGSLIDWRWVLTAAHCTFTPGVMQGSLLPRAPKDINVYAGSINFNDGERLKVKRIIRHENYDLTTQDNDVALLELEHEPVKRSNIELLSLLPENAGPNTTEKNAIVAGWGSTAAGAIPLEKREAIQHLRYAKVEFKSSSTCNSYYLENFKTSFAEGLKRLGKSDDEIAYSINKYYPENTSVISDNMVCAGTNDGAQDACFGDSGGPLIVYRGDKPFQIGIVSWGPSNGCGLTNLFGVYVRLPKFEAWIAAKTQ